MSAFSDLISLGNQRALWLEGKNREFNTEIAVWRSETDWATRTYGPRPLTQRSLLGPVVGVFYEPWRQWDLLDARMAAGMGPKAANVRRAIQACADLVPRLSQVGQTATAEQTQQLNLLRGRWETAINQGRQNYNTWINSPAARHDHNNASLSERFFTQALFATPLGVALQRSGVSMHQVADVTINPVVAAVEAGSRAEAEWARQQSVYGSNNDGKGDNGGGGGAGWGLWDKLALVGIGTLGVGALVVFLKVRRLAPTRAIARTAARAFK